MNTGTVQTQRSTHLRTAGFGPGDAAIQDEDGYYWIRDRYKDMYVSGGENVSPAQVESALLDVPGIAEAAVIGVADEQWVRSARPHRARARADLTADDIRTALSGTLSRFKIPKHFVFIDVMPRTSTGKLMKGDLRALPQRPDRTSKPALGRQSALESGRHTLPEPEQIEVGIAKPLELQPVEHAENLHGEHLWVRMPWAGCLAEHQPRGSGSLEEVLVGGMTGVERLGAEDRVQPHDLRLTRVAAHEVVEQLPHRLLVHRTGRSRTEDRSLVPIVAMAQHFDEQSFLGSEMVLDPRSGQAALLREPREREGVESALADLARRHVDDEGAPFSRDEPGSDADSVISSACHTDELARRAGHAMIRSTCTYAGTEEYDMSSLTLTAFASAVAQVRAGTPVSGAADELLAEVTSDEKLSLLDGDQEFWPGLQEMMQGYNTVPIEMGRLDRLGIPGFRFSDGPRGVVVGHSTAFPVSIARGATWDVELEERIGVAIGAEMRAQGANFFGGVCINLPRHPAWGRVQETYGEDTSICSASSGQRSLAAYAQHAMAVRASTTRCNSMENARFTVDVTADDATLHEVYLPHFRRAVEEGVDGIMTAYNSVNGEWAGQNEHLMEGILRGEWDFRGVTVSDFIFGLRDAAQSLRAGLDVEEPFRQQRAEHLPGDLAAGRASWADVDRAARRILSTQIAFYARDLAEEPSTDVVFSAGHRALSREAAATAAVLVKNDSVDGRPLLPLIASELRKIAVIGRLADLPNTGDGGSSSVRPPAVDHPAPGARRGAPRSIRRPRRRRRPRRCGRRRPRGGCRGDHRRLLGER